MFAVTQAFVKIKAIYAFLGTFAKLRKMTTNFIMSVHLSILKEHNVAPIERIFIKFDILVLFRILCKNLSFFKI